MVEPSRVENRTNPTILAVDDDAACLGILADYLQNSGFRVIVARDGESALEKARYGRPDLILLDLLMPKMDGFETCRRLKADEVSREIPVIFLTALTGLADKVEAFWTGGVDYITKPIQQVEVLARVKTHLALREMQKRLATQNEQLERRVEESTAEMRSINEQLKSEIAERKRAEEAFRKVRDELESRVRERTAEIEAANKDMEVFSYSISHDLRAPLRTIGGFSQIVLEEAGSGLGETSRKHIERIRAAANKMEQLIDDLQTLSRFARQEMRSELVNLSQLAETIIQDIREHDPSRDIEFMVQSGLSVQGDPNLLRMALHHLLENAWKFTSKHLKARIEFGTIDPSEAASRFAPADQGKRVFFVRDDGAGFNMDYVNKLFHPFHRLHSEEEFMGTGIGLVIVQRIVQRHGGRVWVKSEIEKGTTFFFSL